MEDILYDTSEFSLSLRTDHLVSRQENLADFEDVAGSDANIAQLTRNGNMSSRQYDASVYSLKYKDTGCNRRGALPVPLAANDTCLPGWYCEYNSKARRGTDITELITMRDYRPSL